MLSLVGGVEFPNGRYIKYSPAEMTNMPQVEYTKLPEAELPQEPP